MSPAVATRRRPAATPATTPRRRQRPPLRFVGLIAAFFLLILTGAVLVLTASTVAAIEDQGGRSFFYFGRHSVFAFLGCICMFVGMRIDYRWWRTVLWGPLLVLTLAGLGTVLIAGREVDGAKRWIEAGPVNIQPTEFAKFAVIVVLAKFLATRRSQLGRRHRIVHPVVIAIGVLCVLVMAQPDLGTTLIIAGIALGMLFMAGVPGRHIAGLVGLVSAAGVGLALMAPYRRARLMGFLDPVGTRTDDGYQTFQSLVGIANGGLTGVGLGEGRAKWGWLPNAHTDFIFAIVAEELGLVGAAITLSLLAVVVLLGFRTAQGAPDFFGSMLAAGISVWFLLQVVVNVGGVLGALPITGVTLPFLSFGGSSLIANAGAAGVLLNIARQS